MERHDSTVSRKDGDRIPSLDGWRAVSIALVLGGHSEWVLERTGEKSDWLGVVFPGIFGVHCFFLISGFLITTLLLKEWGQKRTISLRRFYARRSIRILPVYIVFVLTLLVFQGTTRWGMAWDEWLGVATFTGNFTLHSQPAAHLWSLAIEEQFYLVWPIVLVTALQSRNEHLPFQLLVLVIVFCPVFRIVGYLYGRDYPIFGAHSTGNFADCLAWGCLGALIWRFHRATALRFLGGHFRAIAISAVAFIVVPHIFQTFFIAGFFTVPFASTIQSIGVLVLLLLSLQYPDTGVFRMLNYRLLTFAGTLSYSVYIWQQIFCSNPSDFGWGVHWWFAFPGWLFASVLAALCSYYVVEKPWLRLRTRFA